MAKKISPYKTMFLVTPNIYNKLLHCIDDGDKKVLQGLNPGNQPPSAPSKGEQIVKAMTQAEIEPGNITTPAQMMESDLPIARNMSAPARMFASSGFVPSTIPLRTSAPGLNRSTDVMPTYAQPDISMPSLSQSTQSQQPLNVSLPSVRASQSDVSMPSFSHLTQSQQPNISLPSVRTSHDDSLSASDEARIERLLAQVPPPPSNRPLIPDEDSWAEMFTPPNVHFRSEMAQSTPNLSFRSERHQSNPNISMPLSSHEMTFDPQFTSTRKSFLDDSPSGSIYESAEEGEEEQDPYNPIPTNKDSVKRKFKDDTVEITLRKSKQKKVKPYIPKPTNYYSVKRKFGAIEDDIAPTPIRKSKVKRRKIFFPIVTPTPAIQSRTPRFQEAFTPLPTSQSVLSASQDVPFRRPRPPRFQEAFTPLPHSQPVLDASNDEPFRRQIIQQCVPTTGGKVCKTRVIAPSDNDIPMIQSILRKTKKGRPMKKQFNCPFCDKIYKAEYHIKKHITDYHKRNAEDVLRDHREVSGVEKKFPTWKRK